MHQRAKTVQKNLPPLLPCSPIPCPLLTPSFSLFLFPYFHLPSWLLIVICPSSACFFTAYPFTTPPPSSLSSHLLLCLLPPTFSSHFTSLHFIIFPFALLFFSSSFLFTVPTFNILSPLPCHLSVLCFLLHCSSLSSPHVLSLLFTTTTPSPSPFTFHALLFAFMHDLFSLCHTFFHILFSSPSLPVLFHKSTLIRY